MEDLCYERNAYIPPLGELLEELVEVCTMNQPIPSVSASDSVVVRDSVLRLPRHSLVVRLTHWINAGTFFALLSSGIAILLAYPRMHWGKTGTVGMPSLFDLPLPFVLDLGIRGPGRYLHFQSAWVLFFTGLIYLFAGFRTGHFRRDLLPNKVDRNLKAVLRTLVHHLKFKRPTPEEAKAYNLLQRLAYLAVIFFLLPFMFVSGLAMSPSFTSVVPVDLLLFGGRQTARTLHFVCANLLVLFFLVHIVMVIVTGFVTQCRGMITGFPTSGKRLS